MQIKIVSVRDFIEGKNMTKKAKAERHEKQKRKRAYKLLFKPTPISRLRHYKSPIKMVGDPPHNGTWKSREKAVYEYEIDRKALDSRGFSNATFYQAHSDNEVLDKHIRFKWTDYDVAIVDNAEMDREEAERDNAAFDYHHENFLEEHNRLRDQLPTIEEAEENFYA